MQDIDERSLTHLLDGMEHAARRDTVKIDDVLNEFGERSLLPFILLAALLLVSPLSGVFGVSSFMALVIILLSAQAVYGRKRLWLPQFLLRREVKSSRLQFGVKWLRKPAAFFDRHSGKRLQFLTTGPIRLLTLVTCVVMPIAWPLLEFVPFASSLGGATVALFVFGLFTRDGLYVLLGYLMILITSLSFYTIVF
ncbi:exopolysaccharide biosynthesis protein [Sulfitobacter litoralis]|uniref:exopolysaccharide biosynthesis protein n=1 Tax=Sulfitobacter litoralis TaxID=335975 RepID=UPI002B275AD0|nr:exopolysaccharide biosynthesis protein [Sulfitobacter litoralis]